jgi:hypothetical protein
VGRREIALRIEEVLRKPACPPLLLYGQRRMGKTSLLYHLPRLLSGRIIPLLVDLQGLPAQAGNPAEFFYALSRAMQIGAHKQREIELPPLPRGESNPFFAFDAWLDALEKVLAPADILLMLDEFIALDHAFASGRLERAAILGFLRHQLQHRPRLKVLLAGSLLLEEIPDWATYLVNARTVRVSGLAEEEVYRLVEQPVPDFALRYTPPARRRVWELTRGHPALVQLLCHEIVMLKNRQPLVSRFLAQPADVEAATPSAINNMRMYFADILTLPGEHLLKELASHGENASIPLSIGQEADTEAESVARDLAHLLKREILEQTGPGKYRFRIELVRRACEAFYKVK